jgi:hypothetical protein
MNKQNKQEPNNQQCMIEDLTVNEDQTEKVRGGDTYVNPPSWGLDRIDQR